jgi:two-component system, OmpR family, sensor histidine kinase QseC
LKLNDKTNRYFITASLIVFSAGGILFYLLFQWIIDHDFNKRLHERKEYYIGIFSQSDSLLHYQQFSANSIGIIPVNHTITEKEIVSDTILFDRIENKFNRYRQVSLGMNVRGENYKIQVRRALVERKDIIQGVVILEALLFIVFVVTLSVLNNKLSKSLWKPFYAALNKIDHYKAEQGETLEFDRSRIDEFDVLSSAIEKMTSRISQEFHILKEFTENASHEIQTPLAIVKGKLEVLIQSPGLSEEQMGMINTASIAATRLSKLNEALLILSRIENRQFHMVEDINLNETIDRHLNDLEDLIKIKGIEVTREYHNQIIFKMNPFLADILFENLIVNAIKHNKAEGIISVAIHHKQLIISNTGEAPKRDPSHLFQRFVKSNSKSHSLGLGLSIVKAILDTYQIPITYSFENGHHTMAISLE